MIFVGIDDTDTLETRGTNQLARALASRIKTHYSCKRITRHQLLNDPRVPFTSKNGSASLVLEALSTPDLEWLRQELIEGMRADYIPGSDPGLCIASGVSREIQEFGLKCQNELVSQREARMLAFEAGIILVGLGGSEDGVIGALAAVGLASGEQDGRVIQLGHWTDDLCGLQPLEVITGRGILVQDLDTGEVIERGSVDVGKKLRPNWRNGQCVLFARSVRRGLESACLFEAVRVS